MQLNRFIQVTKNQELSLFQVYYKYFYHFNYQFNVCLPAVPLTVHNAHYLLKQRDAFHKGVPPPDFPSHSKGEAAYSGRLCPIDVSPGQSRSVMGLEKFPGVDSTLGAKATIEKSNKILFG